LASREAIRARRVSTSDVEVVDDDFRVWSSLSSDDLVFSGEENS
jgi:hypothetical protein